MLQAAPNGLGPAVRVGFTASRKVGNAVQRNRARRRLVALADDLLAGLYGAAILNGVRLAFFG